jgi:hypothetical protein
MNTSHIRADRTDRADPADPAVQATAGAGRWVEALNARPPDRHKTPATDTDRP